MLTYKCGKMPAEVAIFLVESIVDREFVSNVLISIKMFTHDEGE